MQSLMQYKTPAAWGYPFGALVGQQDMKRALLLCAVDPGLGGVLLTGEKGTAKSTAARALARLLPPIKVMPHCPVGCDPLGPLCPACARADKSAQPLTRPTPFVDLPLGATEDRLLGSIDLGAAIKEGRLRFKPGLLAGAHRGILYVDEVNLLPVHLVHLVLDAAASGQVRIEREGISYSHPASFALIASMNPEEGPLGPQLTDRFGLCVRVKGEKNPALRREVLTRRLAFDSDPPLFSQSWAQAEAELSRRIVRARMRLSETLLHPDAKMRAAELAMQSGALGQRAELAMARAARALAALEGQTEAGPELVEEIKELALYHRRPAAPKVEAAPHARVVDGPAANQTADPPKAVRLERGGQGQFTGHKEGETRTLYVMPPDEVKPVATRAPAREGTSLRQAGRRRARQSQAERGRYLRSSARRLGRPLALDATVRAAAPHQISRRTPGGPALVVREPDIREKVRASRRGRLLLFCVDASGSMNAAARMRTTKAAILGLLTEAYVKRDRVGLVAFGGNQATELLPPTSSVEVARQRLAELPTGGKTPLASGLAMTAAILERELARDPKLTPLVVILTDGRPNVPLDSQKAAQAKAGNKGGGWGDGWGDGGYADREVLNLARLMARDQRPRYVIVDTDTGHYHEINLCRPLAQYLGAVCVSLGKLSTERVLDLVKAHW